MRRIYGLPLISVPLLTLAAFAEMPRVTFDFVNEPVTVALTRVAQAWNKPIYFSKKFQGTVTLSLRDIPADVALSQIVLVCKQKLAWQELGDVLLVSPVEEPFTIGSIQISGNSRTTTDTILRNMRTTPDSLVDVGKIRADIQRLRTLGFFRRVDADLLPGPPGRVTLSIDVEEQMSGLATIGLGYAGGGTGAPVQQPVFSFSSDSYSPIAENGHRNVADHPLSTFAADVDTASYSNVRRYLNRGELPPANAVRIEEFINYFPFKVPEGPKDEPFSVVTEVAECPWDIDHRLLRIGVQGRRNEAAVSVPRNLVFLIDVSGSMSYQDKLPLVKSSFRALLDALNENDKVALVVYAGCSGLVLDSTPAGHKAKILEALGRLEAGGSTNGGQGIELAYAVAQRNFLPGGVNRVVLATDGDFNVGAADHSSLLQLIEGKRDQGVYLTVLGFGCGNLKDDTMEMLADRGNGNYAYIDTLAEARRVLVEQAGATLTTIANDVKLQVEFNPLAVGSYRLLGYENRLLSIEDFNDDKKDAGEIGAGHCVTALYEFSPNPKGLSSVDPLRYQRKGSVSDQAYSGEMATLKIRYKNPGEQQSQLMSRTIADGAQPFPTATDDLRFAASVAAFGMLLRHSPESGSASFNSLSEWARGTVGDDAQGYRSEFLQLVRRAEELSAATARR